MKHHRVDKPDPSRKPCRHGIGQGGQNARPVDKQACSRGERKIKSPESLPTPAALREAELAAIVEAGPDREVDGVVRWRRVDLHRVFHERFGVDYHERHVGTLLKRSACPSPTPTAMQLHLDEISRHMAKGAHAVLLLDRAGWHTTAKRDIPKNITPIFLPSRSPELNPVENIWQYLRDNWLSNRVFETYDAIIDAASDAWRRLIAQPEAITSIGMRK